MSKLGSQVNEFGGAYERIRDKFKQKELNENAVKLEAMLALKEIQAQLTTINFLDVLSVMDPNNPLKKDVMKFEEQLATMRAGIETFIVDNQFDSAEEQPEEEVIDEPVEKKETEKISVSGVKDDNTEDVEPEEDPELKKVKTMK